MMERMSMEEKKDFKDTLWMPKTDFPMRGNLPTREPEVQASWDEFDLYEARMKKNAGRESFVLLDGPPYANGNIHMGHALNKVLKDFIVRYKSMAGFEAPYIPGWDTHGLPIDRPLLIRKKSNDMNYQLPTSVHYVKHMPVNKLLSKKVSLSV